MLASPGLRTCPACSRTFGAEMQFCPDDGTTLVSATRDPLSGRVIGERYRLDERLGRGAMGTVYRAVHTRMEKPVAVKLLRAELAGDPEAVARFHREARSASRLDHEHCTRVTDFGQTDDGLLYLVMELLDGESLAARVAKGPLPAGLAAAIGHDVAVALVHAHEHGVIHRDLKPDNVMLARRGRRAGARTVVKVLDFGLAKIAGEAGGGASLTRAGSVFGTPEYMAPEQAEGLPPDARTDIYALGVVLYQLVTGQLPFQAPTVIQLLAQQVDELPQPPRARRPDLAIPPELERVILRCLAKRPADRFADAATVAAALLPLADHAQLDRLLGDSHGQDAPAASTALARSAAAAADVPPVSSTPQPAGTSPVTSAVPSSVPFAVPSAVPPAVPSSMPSSPSVPSSRHFSATPSLSSGEPEAHRGIGRARPRSAVRTAALFLATTALVGVGVVVAARLRPPGATLLALTGAPPAHPLVQARRLLDQGQLDPAEQLLAAERAAHNGAEVQLLLGELAHRRGNRLRALANLKIATRLAPSAAEPHARLAALLRQYGQPEEACREAEAAMQADPRSPAAQEAASYCKAPPP